ncbi:MAG: GTPase [Planctomycetota bacterium]
MSPPGRGAIGVIEAIGPGAEHAVAQMFRPRRRVARDEPVVYGRFVDGRGRTLDDGLLIRVASAPATLWLTPHGNPILIERLLEVLEDLGGVRQLAPVSRLLDHATRGRIAHEAYETIAHARTAGAVAFLLEQADIGFAAWAERARHAAEVDPDELEQLLAHARLGRALLEPATVVLAGPPNAGKSTLFNRLVGEARVVVHSEPGTTRDLIQEVITLGDYPIRVVDGAGLRSPTDAVEREGVNRMREAIRHADLVIWMGPAEAWRPDDRSPADLSALRGSTAGGLALHIISKADQIRARQESPGPTDGSALRVSGLTGEGVEGLASAIVSALFGGPLAPRGVAVPFLPRHEALLRGALVQTRARQDARPTLARLNTHDDDESRSGT